MKKKQIKVVYCRWGLANLYEDRIEINHALKYHKRLRDYIVKHELEHKINSFDLSHEFKVNWKIMPSLFLFVITNKSTWNDFSPIQIKGKKIIYDSNLLLLYLIIIIILVGLFISKKFI